MSLMNHHSNTLAVSNTRRPDSSKTLVRRWTCMGRLLTKPSLLAFEENARARSAFESRATLSRYFVGPLGCRCAIRNEEPV